MILIFSGTGNSAYVARQLGELLQEETIDVFARIRDKDTTALQSSRPWIVVCPTYALSLIHIYSYTSSPLECKIQICYYR